MSRVTLEDTSRRSISHFCAGKDCFQPDPTNFRSTRHQTKDRTFLDKAGIFDFQTILAVRLS